MGKKKSPSKEVVRLTLDVDLKSGDYDLTVNNVSRPGESIDFTRTMALLRKVLIDAEVKAAGGGAA